MVTIREIEVRDRAALLSCISELQAFERTIESNRADPEVVTERYVNDLLENCTGDSGAVFVAERAGHVVGFASIHINERSTDILEQYRDYAYVTDLFVREADRGQGLGRQLMQAVEAHALASGASRIRVGVLASNDAARRLYQTLRYRNYEITLEKALRPEPSRPPE